MRGKLTAHAGTHDVPGITPAGAGKTKTNQRTVKHDEDHPRRCGENSSLRPTQRVFSGSPPQVRGKRLSCAKIRPYNRITPAGAGKTVDSVHDVSIAQDHPRRCGENLRVRASSIRSRGSPPQVRGKQGQGKLLCGKNRITPAGAGKTCGMCLPQRDGRDHPRRCGENAAIPADLPSLQGSPPQVRGKRIL